MKKHAFFIPLFICYSNICASAHQNTQQSRFIDEKTEQAIKEIPDQKLQNMLSDFARNPQSNSVKLWLNPHGFATLNNTQLLNATAQLGAYEGVLILSLIILDDKLDSDFSKTREYRDQARNALANAQLPTAEKSCNEADTLLTNHVRPALEKITSIYEEKLQGAAAKIAHNVCGSLKTIHSKVSSEEQKIEQCKADIQNLARSLYSVRGE